MHAHITPGSITLPAHTLDMSDIEGADAARIIGSTDSNGTPIVIGIYFPSTNPRAHESVFSCGRAMANAESLLHQTPFTLNQRHEYFARSATGALTWTERKQSTVSDDSDDETTSDRIIDEQLDQQRIFESDQQAQSMSLEEKQKLNLQKREKATGHYSANGNCLECGKVDFHDHTEPPDLHQLTRCTALTRQPLNIRDTCDCGNEEEHRLREICFNQRYQYEFMRNCIQNQLQQLQKLENRNREWREHEIASLIEQSRLRKALRNLTEDNKILMVALESTTKVAREMLDTNISLMTKTLLDADQAML
jgi:hypothetical protein